MGKRRTAGDGKAGVPAEAEALGDLRKEMESRLMRELEGEDLARLDMDGIEGVLWSALQRVKGQVMTELAERQAALTADEQISQADGKQAD